MRKFEVGDRVITKWDDSLMARSLSSGEVPDGEHVIIEISGGDARLDDPDGYWYPLRFMTKVDDAPAVKDDDVPAFPVADISKCQCPGMSLRDYFAAKVMQADWSSNGTSLAFSIETTDESLKKWATLYYRMADAMLEARKN